MYCNGRARWDPAVGLEGCPCTAVLTDYSYMIAFRLPAACTPAHVRCRMQCVSLPPKVKPNPEAACKVRFKDTAGKPHRLCTVTLNTRIMDDSLFIDLLYMIHGHHDMLQHNMSRQRCSLTAK